MLDELEASGDFTSLHTIVDAQFAVEVSHMPFDGIDGDDQSLSYLRVATPGDQQGEHPLLLCGEWFDK